SGVRSRSLASGYVGQFRSARLVRAELSKVIHQLGWTPYKFPLGYRRLAPFVFQSLGSVEGGTRGSWQSFSEVGFGLNLELLINHDIPIVVKVERSQVSGQVPNTSFQLQKIFEFF
ncbi:MAG: hypothetical protein WCH11_07495, partial [Bdellovibrio sp.]